MTHGREGMGTAKEKMEARRKEIIKGLKLDTTAAHRECPHIWVDRYSDNIIGIIMSLFIIVIAEFHHLFNSGQGRLLFLAAIRIILIMANKKSGMQAP